MSEKLENVLIFVMFSLSKTEFGSKISAQSHALLYMHHFHTNPLSNTASMNRDCVGKCIHNKLIYGAVWKSCPVFFRINPLSLEEYFSAPFPPTL